MNKFLASILPPFIVRFGAYLLNRQITFVGPYFSWDKANSDCLTYSSDLILNKVYESTLNVSKGGAFYEQDGICFYQEKYNWELLVAILNVARDTKENKVVIFDFGGALGSSYFRNRNLLKVFNVNFVWIVIEQVEFAKRGNDCFKSDELLFFETIDAALICFKPSMIVLGSVIQFIEKPFELISDICSLSVKLIYIDRLFYSKTITKPELFVQKVPSYIYLGSYPCWVFPQNYIIKQIESFNYKCISTFECGDILSNFESNGHIILNLNV